jgi:ComF family protein
MTWKNVVLGLLEQLAPQRCAGCDRATAELDAGFCAGCARGLEPVLACDDPDVQAGFFYGGPVADAIARLKYRGRSELAAPLSETLVARAERWAARVDLVTAVPITPAKLRARGYNQSGLLAKHVARALDLPFRPALVRRVRTGARQVGNDRSTRLLLVPGVFKVSGDVRERSLLIIDDVRTTGATLHELQRVLSAAGARAALGLVLAQAERSR